MPMTSKEIVRKAILFEDPDRIPILLPEEYGSDFSWVGISPSPDDRPISGRDVEIDEWGAVWENLGNTTLGQVTDFPLKDWSEFDKLSIPDIRNPERWKIIENSREDAGDKFLLVKGISIYERVLFIRGLENTWMDIHHSPADLCKLIDILVEMNLYAIERYAELGADGYIFCDDWGLQNCLMISPDSWRQIWKPRYARIFQAAHNVGLLTFLHSCGHITAILSDLIEVGLDVIQMNQQENMGVEYLGTQFGGKIAFFCPVDIQNTMVNGSIEEIRAYCHKLANHLGRDNAGFIPTFYYDPATTGHSQQSVDAMCEEFLKISRASLKTDATI